MLYTVIPSSLLDFLVSLELIIDLVAFVSLTIINPQNLPLVI